MNKYDQYKSEFISNFIEQKVKNFTDFAIKKGWIKKSVSENGTIGKLKPKWEKEALAKLGKIEQEVEKHIIVDLEITHREALKVKREIFVLISKRLKENKLSVSELKKIWEIARTEAGQTIQVDNQQLRSDPKRPIASLADLLNSINTHMPNTTIAE